MTLQQVVWRTSNDYQIIQMEFHYNVYPKTIDDIQAQSLTDAHMSCRPLHNDAPIDPQHFQPENESTYNAFMEDGISSFMESFYPGPSLNYL